MNIHGSIAVVPVKNLEAGDQMAFGFLGAIVSGKVTGLAHFPYNLTDEQRTYMQENDLKIPDGKYESLAGGRGYVLVFGDFRGSGKDIVTNNMTLGHMYMEKTTNVAVFLLNKDNDN